MSLCNGCCRNAEGWSEWHYGVQGLSYIAAGLLPILLNVYLIETVGYHAQEWKSGHIVHK